MPFLRVMFRRQNSGNRLYHVHSEGVNVQHNFGLVLRLSKVSCLAASPGYRVPVVLAGTFEGTVFAFRLSHGMSSVGDDHGGEWVVSLLW